MTDPSRNRRIDQRCEQYVEDYVALDPLAATYLGVPDYDGQLTDLSLEGFAAREALDRQARADVAALEPVDAREEAAQESFLERLAVALEQYDARSPQSRVSVATSGLHRIRQIFDLMNTEGEDAWAAIDARLAAVPSTL